MIDAAIVGVGWWGRKIVDAVQGRSERIRFTCGVSKEPDEVRGFAAGKGLRLCADLDDVLRDPSVQAVVLATPHALHAGQILATAAAGKAVFCEKPLALTRADAVRSVDACARAGVVLGLGTNKRFWPGNRELRAIVAGGTLGRILHVEGHYSNENSGKHFSPWRADPAQTPGAGLTGSGIHVVDALVSVAGAVRSVHAQVLRHKPAPDPLDSITALFAFANGASGTLGAVRSTPFYWRLHVFGTEGSAEALGENELVLRYKGRGAERLVYPPVDSLLAEFDAFADAVAGRAPPPLSTDQMIDGIGAFEAIVESLARGGPVAVPEG